MNPILKYVFADTGAARITVYGHPAPGFIGADGVLAVDSIPVDFAGGYRRARYLPAQRLHPWRAYFGAARLIAAVPASPAEAERATIARVLGGHLPSGVAVVEEEVLLVWPAHAPPWEEVERAMDRSPGATPAQVLAVEGFAQDGFADMPPLAILVRLTDGRFGVVDQLDSARPVLVTYDDEEELAAHCTRIPKHPTSGPRFEVPPGGWDATPPAWRPIEWCDGSGAWRCERLGASVFRDGDAWGISYHDDDDAREDVEAVFVSAGEAASVAEEADRRALFRAQREALLDRQVVRMVELTDLGAETGEEDRYTGPLRGALDVITDVVNSWRESDPEAAGLDEDEIIEGLFPWAYGDQDETYDIEEINLRLYLVTPD